MLFHGLRGYLARWLPARGSHATATAFVDRAFAVAQAQAPVLWAADSRQEPARQAKFEHLCVVLAQEFGRLDAGLQQMVLEEVIDRLDIGLREAGVGDMAVGKHVRAFAGALHGRLVAYTALLREGKVKEFNDLAKSHGVGEVV
jgi:hypothetical protein